GVVSTAELERSLAAPYDRLLIGRRAEIQAIEASLGAVLSDGKPGLFTLIGAAGLGKSRLLASAAAAAQAACGEAQVIVLGASLASSGPRGAATVKLLAASLGVSGDPPADPQAYCMAELGDALGAEVAPAVAAALGWPGAPPLAPGAAGLQSGLMRAIAEGLR